MAVNLHKNNIEPHENFTGAYEKTYMYWMNFEIGTFEKENTITATGVALI